MNSESHKDNPGKPATPCYVIAEVGFNHEGDMDVAKTMIHQAAQSGAHAVKFQTYRASDIALPSSPHFNLIEKGEMDKDQHSELAQCARDNGIEFLSTPYSRWAVDLLEEIDVPAYKIASMDCTNHHLLGYIAETAKPIYLSTGMATVEEISATLEFLQGQGSGAVSLLHCLSLYPSKAEDLNVEMIPFLKKRFQIPVGYSDHFPGTQACLAAFMMGAEIIETHFTLDSTREGGDHYHSVTPTQLKQLIEDMELFHTMRGQAEAIHQRPDRDFTHPFRRGIYSAHALKKGHSLKEEDVLFTRPASEMSPNDFARIEGKTLNQDIEAYQPITHEMIEP